MGIGIDRIHFIEPFKNTAYRLSGYTHTGITHYNGEDIIHRFAYCIAILITGYKVLTASCFQKNLSFVRCILKSIVQQIHNNLLDNVLVSINIRR